jgi:hypothetical protein
MDFLRQEYGNLASVLGLILTVFGFGLTLWSIRAARAAAREAIRRIGSQLLEGDITRAIRHLQQVRASARDRKWRRSIDYCDEVRECLAGLVGHPRLTANDRQFLSASIDNLGQLVQTMYAMSRRPRRGQGLPRLDETKYRLLDEMIDRLGNVQGSLRATVLETPHG